jgi:hypothetical protein
LRHESIAPVVKEGGRVEVVSWWESAEGYRRVEVLGLTPEDVEGG